MLEVIRPELYEMSFREYLMADEMTMSYNAKWGGTIPFPREEWEDWYDTWIRKPDNKRYYRYLKNEEDEFVVKRKHVELKPSSEIVKFVRVRL